MEERHHPLALRRLPVQRDPPPVDVDRLADDEHGVILQRGKAVKDGQTHELNEVFVFHFRDGKISEMWYVPVDQAAVDALIG